jgi:hypothetical protein
MIEGGTGEGIGGRDKKKRGIEGGKEESNIGRVRGGKEGGKWEGYGRDRGRDGGRNRERNRWRDRGSEKREG